MKYIFIALFFLGCGFQSNRQEPNYAGAQSNKEKFICHVVIENQFINLESEKNEYTPEEYQLEIDILKDYNLMCDTHPEIHKLF